jgi:hypothetical protein
MCRQCGARSERMRKAGDRLDAPACPTCGARTALALSVPGKVGGGAQPGMAAAGHTCAAGGCCGGGVCAPGLN